MAEDDVVVRQRTAVTDELRGTTGTLFWHDHVHPRVLWAPYREAVRRGGGEVRDDGRRIRHPIPRDGADEHLLLRRERIAVGPPGKHTRAHHDKAPLLPFAPEFARSQVGEQVVTPQEDDAAGDSHGDTLPPAALPTTASPDFSRRMRSSAGCGGEVPRRRHAFGAPPRRSGRRMRAPPPQSRPERDGE